MSLIRFINAADQVYCKSANIILKRMKSNPPMFSVRYKSTLRLFIADDMSHNFLFDLLKNVAAVK